MTIQLVDPAFPVELNVSVSVAPAPADLIRKFMKVSSGDTNLANGTYQAVTNSSYSSIFTSPAPTNETLLWLNAFFAQAPNATAYVLEAANVADLDNFIDSGVAPMYEYSCPQAWYASNINLYTPAYLTGGKSAASVVAAWTAVSNGSFDITINGAAQTVTAIDFSSGVSAMSDVAGKIQAAIRALTSSTETVVWSIDHFVISSANTTSASAITVTSAEGTGMDISGAGATLFMDCAAGQGTVTPKALVPNSLVALTAEFVSPTASTYFAIEETHDIDPAQDPNFAAYNAVKSLFPVYGNGVTTQSVPGTMAGIKASSVYDLSSSNRMTPLCYKRTNGVTLEALNNNFRIDLNNTGSNYIGQMQGSNMIFNGRNADLNSWDYWYSFDWFQINLLNALIAAVINGSNVPSAAINYDQSGINALKATCEGVANLGMQIGTITAFGSDYNVLTQSIDNPGKFAAVPFFPYIAQNPADYAAEIYRGLSAYIQIGRFIRQVIINVEIS